MQKIAIGEKITLFQGDALKILAALPDASVDAVLTDPPYSSAWRTLAERQLGQRQKYQKSRNQGPNWPTMLGDNRGSAQLDFLVLPLACGSLSHCASGCGAVHYNTTANYGLGAGAQGSVRLRYWNPAPSES